RADGRARLRRDGARPRVRGGGAGPGGRLLQHDGRARRAAERAAGAGGGGMKLREVFRFEVAYQLRRPWPWLAFAILVVFAFENTRAGMLPVTLPQDFILNSPFIITVVTVFSCLVWLLVASAMAGEAAARDV